MSKKWGRRTAVVAGLGGVVLAGTGSAVVVASTQQSAPVSPPACTLLTQPDAEGHLSGELQVQDLGSTCSYTVTDPTAFASLALTTDLADVEGAELGQGVQTFAAATGSQAEQVPGVGDDAWATTSQQLRQLLVRSGEHHFSVVLLGEALPADQARAVLVEAARTAVARLP